MTTNVVVRNKTHGEGTIHHLKCDDLCPKLAMDVDGQPVAQGTLKCITEQN